MTDLLAVLYTTIGALVIIILGLIALQIDKKNKKVNNKYNTSLEQLEDFVRTMMKSRRSFLIRTYTLYEDYEKMQSTNEDMIIGYQKMIADLEQKIKMLESELETTINRDKTKQEIKSITNQIDIMKEHLDKIKLDNKSISEEMGSLTNDVNSKTIEVFHLITATLTSEVIKAINKFNQSTTLLSVALLILAIITLFVQLKGCQPRN